MGLSICLGEDAFVVKYRLRGDNSWFFPCGKPEAVREFISAMLERSEPLRLSYVRDEDADFLRREFPGRFQIAEVPGDSEYIYDRAGQVSLDGGRFVRLRNDIHRSERGHEPVSYTHLDVYKRQGLRSRATTLSLTRASS